MSADLERLRRGLYRPGATEEDREAYRRAAPAVRPDPGEQEDPQPAPPSRRPRRRPVLVLLAVVALGAAVPVLVATSSRAPAPAPEPPVAVTRPPVEVVSTTAGLAADASVQRSVDLLLADGDADGGTGAQAGAAGDRLDATVRDAVLSAASTRTVTATAGGTATEGRVTIALPRPVRVEAGAVLLLSTAMRDPAAATWEVRGRRAGEPAEPHPVVVVAPRAGRLDRLQVAVLRVPESMTVTSVAVRVDPYTPFRYRLERHDAAVCPAVEAPYCVPRPTP